MGITLTQLLAQANNHLQFADTTAYTSTEREMACASAVQEYSRRRPQISIEAYTGIDTSAPFYDLPTSWIEGFSVIVEIEYPINQVNKTTIDPGDWSIDLMPTGKKIRFYNNAPGENETFWVKYIKNYSFDSNGDSEIDDVDLKGLSYLAVSIMCNELSTFFASKANPSLANAEIIGYPDRVSEYSTKARDWYKKYEAEIKSDLTSTWSSIPFLDFSYWDRTNQ